MTASPFPPRSVSQPITVRNVVLAPDDDAQTRREKLARIAINDLYQFVSLLNVDGTPLDVNPSALEGAGLRLSDIQGKLFWKARWWHASPEAEAYAQDCMQRAASGEFVQGEVEIFGAAGGTERIIIDCSWTPIRDDQGHIIFVLAEARNITEKKRVEAELAAKNKELNRLLTQIERLSQLKDELFANVSHELRTPLALILGPVSSMLMQDDLNETQRQNLETIHRNASTLLKYVNELLDLAKFDAGHMGIRYTEVDAAAILREAAAHFDALAHQLGLDFQVSAPAALPAQIDADKFERVVLNLLSNAFKSTPAGGQIRCRVETGANGEHLRLSVQDSGPGIDASLREAVFERFRQGAGGHASTFSGTGLGLALVKQYVELHGGSIHITDGELHGAAFQVLLPLKAPAGAAVERSRPVAERQGWDRQDEIAAALRPSTAADARESGRDGAPVVLVAEDNPEMRRFISQVLGDRYRLRLAATGEQALAMALEHAPDLILTDLMMPGLSGDRLVKAVREQATLSQVPIVVLSAKADETLRLKLLSESVQDYVTKPFSPDELRARVQNLVILKQARDALQKELDSQNQDVAQLTQQLIASKQAQQRSFDAQQEAQNELARVTRATALGELAASIAHEINQPLAGVVANAHAGLRWLTSSPSNTEEVRDAIQRIVRDANRASDVVTRIRRFLKRGELQRTPVAIHEVITQVVGFVREKARTEGVKWRVSVERDCPTVLADRIQLQQVLLNLLMNGIDAMKGIEDRPRLLDIKAFSHQQGVVVAVRDQGTGLEPHVRERIFDAFYTSKPEGLGMGLSISHSIIEAHAGRLWADNNPDGPGATFHFTIPLDCPELA